MQRPVRTFTGTGRSTPASISTSKEMKNKNRHTKPSKFKAWSDKMYEVIKDPDTVIFTDEQLVDYVNGLVDIDQTIHINTFKSWIGRGQRSVENQESISAEEAKEFRIKLRYVRAKQKMHLTKDMLDPDNKTAYKQQWILERKFEDMKQNPTLQLSSNPTIQIEAGDPAQRKILEGLFNGTGDTIDIEHEEVEPEKLEENGNSE